MPCWHVPAGHLVSAEYPLSVLPGAGSTSGLCSRLRPALLASTGRRTHHGGSCGNSLSARHIICCDMAILAVCLRQACLHSCVPVGLSPHPIASALPAGHDVRSRCKFGLGQCSMALNQLLATSLDTSNQRSPEQPGSSPLNDTAYCMMDSLSPHILSQTHDSRTLESRSAGVMAVKKATTLSLAVNIHS